MLGVLVVATALAGCSSDDRAPVSSVSPAASLLTAPPVATLPAGVLAGLVLQPREVPLGLVPILRATGPAEIGRIAGFSKDISAATKALRAHGFAAAYVVQYADPDSGRVISNVAVRFATAAGAAADLTADLGAAAASSTPVPMPVVGDQSGAVRQAYTAAGPHGELVTLRFRVGAVTYLVALGGREAVSVDELRALGQTLVARSTV
ncbi:MAG: hypothetical protein ABR520_12140 [Mycobacteriales bacterium]